MIWFPQLLHSINSGSESHGSVFCQRKPCVKGTFCYTHTGTAFTKVPNCVLIPLLACTSPELSIQVVSLTELPYNCCCNRIK